MTKHWRIVFFQHQERASSYLLELDQVRKEVISVLEGRRSDAWNPDEAEDAQDDKNPGRDVGIRSHDPCL